MNSYAGLECQIEDPFLITQDACYLSLLPDSASQFLLTLKLNCPASQSKVVVKDIRTNIARLTYWGSGMPIFILMHYVRQARHGPSAFITRISQGSIYHMLRNPGIRVSLPHCVCYPLNLMNIVSLSSRYTVIVYVVISFCQIRMHSQLMNYYPLFIFVQCF